VQPRGGSSASRERSAVAGAVAELSLRRLATTRVVCRAALARNGGVTCQKFAAAGDSGRTARCAPLKVSGGLWHLHRSVGVSQATCPTKGTRGVVALVSVSADTTAAPRPYPWKALVKSNRSRPWLAVAVVTAGLPRRADQHTPMERHHRPVRRPSHRHQRLRGFCDTPSRCSRAQDATPADASTRRCAADRAPRACYALRAAVAPSLGATAGSRPGAPAAAAGSDCREATRPPAPRAGHGPLARIEPGAGRTGAATPRSEGATPRSRRPSPTPPPATTAPSQTRCSPRDTPNTPARPAIVPDPPPRHAQNPAGR
jgi:hypothetical protein